MQSLGAARPAILAPAEALVILRSVHEHLSPQARQVLAVAQDQAVVMGHDYVGTEHLLLGLLAHQDTLAGRVLESLGVRQSHVQSEIERIVGRSERRSPAGEIPLTPLAQGALDRTLREVR